MNTVIILEGGAATGKTTIANLLTYKGQAGVILDYHKGRAFELTTVGIRQLLKCPRVVICTESAARVRSDPIFEELFNSGSPKEILIWRIARGESTPIIPRNVLAEPGNFRLWLLNQGNYSFSGGIKELSAIVQKLPEYPTLADLSRIKHRDLHMK